jgi:hypothetical protein
MVRRNFKIHSQKGIDPNDVGEALMSIYKSKKTNPSDVVKVKNLIFSHKVIQSIHTKESAFQRIHTKFKIL